MAEVNTSRWNTIYPAYLNSNRTVAEGRRISKKKCCPDPCWQEMRDVLESTGAFEVVGEGNKTYPREVDKETPANRGRVRYHSIKEHDQLKNKTDILIFLADMIPRLKSRTQKGSTHAQAADPTAGTAGKKKKGKK